MTRFPAVQPTLAAALAAALLAIPLAALLPATPAQARLPSHCIALASAPGLETPGPGNPGPGNPGPHGPETLMRAALSPPAADQVAIRYLDHASFAILAEDGTLAVTDYTGTIGAAARVPDAVTMNRAHSSHWTAYPDPAIPHVLRGWPEGGLAADHRLDLGGMLIRNVPTDTRGPFGEGAQADGNSIFIFEVAGLCIGHLGHLHQIPGPEDYAAIGRLDIVMVPVDGGYTMRTADMAGVVRQLRASVVIPMHWFSRSSLTAFLAEMAGDFDVVETGLSDMTFSRANLPGRPTILVLDPRWLD